MADRFRVIAVCNQKGGVGKTTTTINLGGALAAQGWRVLLADLDPQGHLTQALKIPMANTPPATLAGALTGVYTGDPAALIVLHEAAYGSMGVIPNGLDMFTVGRELDKLRAREGRLARVLEPLAGLFDYCLLDCPPALDVLTDNALNAADGVLIPIQAEDSSLHAVRLLWAQIEALEADLRADRLLELLGLVVSMLERGPGGQAKSLVGRTVLQAFEELPPDRHGRTLRVVATIPRATMLTEAWRYGQTAGEYAPGSEHAAEYAALAKELAK